MNSDVAYQPWKHLVTADNLQIGMLMVSFLESEGIDARIANDTAGRYEIVGSGTLLRGAKIEVPANQLTDAAGLLAERKAGNFRFSDEVLSYAPASMEAIEAHIDATSPVSRSVGNGSLFQKIVVGAAFIGFVFGLGGLLDSHSPLEENRARLMTSQQNYVILTLASGGTLLALGASALLARRRKGS